ncbi:hypothetical protein SAMN03084138_03161 [Enterovibrio norvegicus DSM 15893]|uniref:Uncharacterized protein n=1 Tax=Enterovibrio norvegicus DSM 15893 TaxID=1121869 RepID=A0A1I5TCN8_9GAMM|nr:hypothetical protein SAMN03084138_03161 [Enterovibrio norvegicus DSM 15893]
MKFGVLIVHIQINIKPTNNPCCRAPRCRDVYPSTDADPVHSGVYVSLLR